jgi:hypothetical protein
MGRLKKIRRDHDIWDPPASNFFIFSLFYFSSPSLASRGVGPPAPPTAVLTPCPPRRHTNHLSSLRHYPRPAAARLPRCRCQPSAPRDAARLPRCRCQPSAPRDAALGFLPTDVSTAPRPPHFSVRFGGPRSLARGVVVQRFPHGDVGDAAAPAGPRWRGGAPASAGYGHDWDLLPRPAVARHLPARSQPRLRLLRALPLLRHHLQQRVPPIAPNPPPRHVSSDVQHLAWLPISHQFVWIFLVWYWYSIGVVVAGR